MHRTLWMLLLLLPVPTLAADRPGHAVVEHASSEPLQTLDWSAESSRDLDEWLRTTVATTVVEGGRITVRSPHAPKLVLAIHAAQESLRREGPSLRRRAQLVQLLSALHHLARQGRPDDPLPPGDALAHSVMTQLPGLAEPALADLRWHSARVLAIVPVHPATLEASARAEMDAGNWTSAIPFLTRSLERDPTDAEAWKSLSHAQDMAGFPVESKHAWEKARSLLPRLSTTRTIVSRDDDDQEIAEPLESREFVQSLLDAASHEKAHLLAEEQMAKTTEARAHIARSAAIGLLTRLAMDHAERFAGKHLPGDAHRFFRAQLAAIHALTTGESETLHRARTLLAPLPSPAAALLRYQITWVLTHQGGDNTKLTEFLRTFPAHPNGDPLNSDALPRMLSALETLQAHHALHQRDVGDIHERALRIRRHAPRSAVGAYYAGISALIDEDIPLAQAHVDHGLTLAPHPGMELALHRLGVMTSQRSGDLGGFRAHLSRIADLWHACMPRGSTLERATWNPSVRILTHPHDTRDSSSPRLVVSIHPVLNAPFPTLESLQEVLRQHGLLDSPEPAPTTTR